MNKTVYRIVVMSVAVILLLTGTYIGLRISNNVAQEPVIDEPIEQVEVPTSVVINKNMEEDIEVTYEDYYITCEHTVTSKNMEFGTTIDKIKEKVDKEYKVIEETDNTILFRKEIDSNCPNHFELRLEDDFVMIYQRVSDEISIMYKNTEVPKTRIRDELIIELEKGIQVDSLEELNMYIEDIES